MVPGWLMRRLMMFRAAPSYWRTRRCGGLRGVAQSPADEVELEPAVMRTVDTMPKSRIDHQLEVLSRGLKSLHQPHGITHRDVIVDGAVDQQQLAVEVPRRLHHRTRFVAIGVVLGQTHEPLSVNRVVVAPIGDRRTGDTGGEEVAVSHRERR